MTRISGSLLADGESNPRGDGLTFCTVLLGSLGLLMLCGIAFSAMEWAVPESVSSVWVVPLPGIWSVGYSLGQFLMVAAAGLAVARVVSRRWSVALVGGLGAAFVGSTAPIAQAIAIGWLFDKGVLDLWASYRAETLPEIVIVLVCTFAFIVCLVKGVRPNAVWIALCATGTLFYAALGVEENVASGIPGTGAWETVAPFLISLPWAALAVALVCAVTCSTVRFRCI